jgi:hypothetical protein
MTSKRKFRKRLVADRQTARADARLLALDLERRQSSYSFDALDASVVLEPGEIAYRELPAMFSRHTGMTALFSWTPPAPVSVIITDHRLLVRIPDGSVFSLWWTGVHGFQADLNRESLVLDYGDGFPRCLTGPTIPVVAVAAIAFLYGLNATTTHPALAPLRAVNTSNTYRPQAVQKPLAIESPKPQTVPAWWPKR